MKEVWKDIKGYEGYYQVSDLGNVKRINKNGNRLVKGRNGIYLTVDLSKNGIKKTCNIHRLVAETFMPEHKENDEVNHLDGDKHNNKLTNLQWVTQKQNMEHAVSQLNHYAYGKKPRPVWKIDPKTNRKICLYGSVSEAAKSLGKMSSRANITYCCQGYAKTVSGYKWEYAD